MNRISQEKNKRNKKNFNKKNMIILLFFVIAIIAVICIVNNINRVDKKSESEQIQSGSISSYEIDEKANITANKIEYIYFISKDTTALSIYVEAKKDIKEEKYTVNVINGKNEIIKSSEFYITNLKKGQNIKANVSINQEISDSSKIELSSENNIEK